MALKNKVQVQSRFGRFMIFVVFLFIAITISYIMTPKFLYSDQIQKLEPDTENPDTISHFIGNYISTVDPNCSCTKITSSKSGLELEIKSACNIYSDHRGLHQKVVSYSFFGSKESSFYKGIAVNAELVAKMYPGWIMRTYHNIGPDDIEGTKYLCSLSCRNPHLDLCYIKDLERTFTHLSLTYGTMWRFLVMGDVTVDVFALRDLDATIYQREVDAVNEWLASNKTFHVMRDHSGHYDNILAGMWGAKNTNGNVQQMQSLLHKMLEQSSKGYKSLDQDLLKKIIWPLAKGDMMCHDSYYCKKFEGTKPWPSQRVNGTFVGDKNNMRIKKECPKECRPPKHEDWLFC